MPDLNFQGNNELSVIYLIILDIFFNNLRDQNIEKRQDINNCTKKRISLKRKYGKFFMFSLVAV